MKKVLSFLIGFIFTGLIFAQTQNLNQHKIWSVDSDTYKYITYLYLAEGHSLPNSTGPWSTQELRNMVLNVEPVKVENEQLYNKILLALNEDSKFCTKDGFHFNLGVSFNPEIYVHSNPEVFNLESDWNYDFEKRHDVLSIYSDSYIGNNIYAFTNYGMGYASYCANETHQKMLYSPVFMSNVPFLPIKDVTHLSVNFPDRAFISAGGEHWSASFGRDVIRWGNGETGNMIIGGNAKYDNNFRFSAFYNAFKYSTICIFYPHVQNLNKTGQDQGLDGLKLFMAHRMDFRFWQDKINLAITEAVLYQNASNTFDITYFNPMNLYHNYYIRGNGNSIMGVDLDYTIIPGLNVYGEFAMDETSSIGEPATESEKGGRPGKNGFLGGVKYVHPTSLGILKLNMEGVYASPYLYLREKYNESSKTQGLSLYGHVREFQNHDGIEYIRNCIGYVYGGDCAVADFKAELDSLGNWKAGFETFYMAHGTIYNDIYDDWMHGSMDFIAKEDKTDRPQGTDPSNPSGEIENFLRLSLTGDYKFFDWLGTYAGIDNWFIWNKDNKVSSMVYDFQLYMGVEIKY